MYTDRRGAIRAMALYRYLIQNESQFYEFFLSHLILPASWVNVARRKVLPASTHLADRAALAYVKLRNVNWTN